MALVFFDGFQDAQQSAKPEWSVGAANTFGNVAGRDGSTNGAAGWPGNARALVFTLGTATLIHGFAFQCGSAPIGSATNQMAWAQGATPNWLLWMCPTATGFLDFRWGATAFSTGTSIGVTSGHAPLLANQWRHLQIKYVAHL